VTRRLTAHADEIPVVDRPRTEMVVPVPLPSVVTCERAVPLGSMSLHEEPRFVVLASVNDVLPTGAVRSRHVTRTGMDPVVRTVERSRETRTWSTTGRVGSMATGWVVRLRA
jgi:hypothetical protein